MENKKSLYKGLKHSFFAASRLVFLDPPETAPAGAKTSKTKEVLSMIDAMLRSDNVKNFPKDHPLKGMAGGVEDKFRDLDPKSITEANKKDGVLTIKFTESGLAQEMKIEGMDYAYLFWPEVRSELKHSLDGSYPDGAKLDAIVQAALSGGESSKVYEIITKLVKSKRDVAMDDLRVFEGYKVAADTAASTKRVDLKKRIDTGTAEKRTRRALEKLKPGFTKKASMDINEFRKQVDAGGVKDKLYIDKFKLNPDREGRTQIDAKQWKLTSQAEIVKTHAEFDRIGLLEHPNKAFFEECFHIVYNAYSDSTNPHLSAHKEYFNNPERYRDEIIALGPSGPFNPTDFFRAYNELMVARGIVYGQDAFEELDLGRQEGLGRDTAANKVHDFFKSNLDAVKTALRNKDYATVGMYGVGLWAIYKSLKASGVLKEDGDGMKYLAYGLAAYCGVKFAENAGYDLLKMAGFRDPNFEVKGTSMEAFYNALRGCEKKEDRELAKDVDWQIVVRVSEVNLQDLQKWREKSNDDGLHFISPHLMPDVFPGLANEYMSIERLGLGKNASKDNTGMGNIKLTPAQKEYKRVGLQLYKIAAMMEVVYDNTLRIDDHPNNPYKDWEYKVAITKGSRRLGKVRHLANAVADFAPLSADRKLKSDEVKKWIQEKVFEKYENAGVSVDSRNKAGHYTAYVKGYPVMFVPDGKKGYRVYLMSEYGGGSNAGSGYMKGFHVPYDGDPGDVGQKIINEVDAKMKKLLRPVADVNGRQLSTLTWDGNSWKCKVVIDAGAFGLPKTIPTDATIIPSKTGKGVTVRLLDGSGMRLNLNESFGESYPMGVALIPFFVKDKKFSSLGAFANVGQLRLEDVDTTKHTFTAKFGRNNFGLKVKWSAAKGFEFADPAEEKKLLENRQFAFDYVEALESDENFYLNKTIDKIKKLVGTSPDNLLMQAWDKITGQGFGSQEGYNLDFASGTIPDYLTNGVIDGTKYQVLSKLRNSVKNCSSLEKLNLFKDTTLHDTEIKLEHVYKTLVKERANMKDWDRIDFMLNVVYPIRAAGSVSSTYRSARHSCEVGVYKEIAGPMLSDFDKDTHLKASKLMNVFLFYTAHLDNEKYKTIVQGSFPLPPTVMGPPSTYGEKEVSISLDDLKNPPTPKYPALIASGLNKRWEDPGLRGHFILNYMEYVKGEVIAHAKDDDVVPGPAGWKGIKDFETWAAQEGTEIPMNELDRVSPFTHSIPAGEYPFAPTSNKKKPTPRTELEKAIVTEFNVGISQLASIFGREYLNVGELKLYLNRKPTNIDDPDTGRFRWVKMSSDGKFHCALREWANEISTIAPNSRSKQMELIRDKVKHRLINVVIKDGDAGGKRFFYQKPGLRAWLVQKWPALKTSMLTSWAF